jgi:hypothetical protein
MCADTHTLLAGETHRRLHHLRVSGVKPAGNIGRTDHRHHLGVCAQAPRPKAFAHVAVEVYTWQSCTSKT